MEYPLYVRRDGDGGFRASLPDFPRADVRGDSFGELKRNAQEIVELMYDRSEQLIPVPTGSTSELHALDMDDGEGLWMFIDIDLARLTSRAVGVQFSLLESLAIVWGERVPASEGFLPRFVLGLLYQNTPILAPRSE